MGFGGRDEDETLFLCVGGCLSVFLRSKLAPGNHPKGGRRPALGGKRIKLSRTSLGGKQFSHLPVLACRIG